MGHPRIRAKRLPEKLLAIRNFLNVGQVDMATKLQFEILSYSRRQYQIKPSRISEYETGRREPNLFVLLAYVRLAQVAMESLLDDEVIGNSFRERLGKESRYVTLSRRIKSKREQAGHSD